MGELCARAGYASVDVASVSAHAGVSTQTFYQCFQNRDDCLAAALGAAAGRVLHEPPASGGGRRAHPARLALEALLRASDREPDAARLLFCEASAAGPSVRGELQLLLAEYECALEVLLDGSRGARPLDLPAAAVTGALGALVSRELRTQGGPRLLSLSDDIWAWASSYALPSGKPRSSVGACMLLPAAAAGAADLAVCPSGLGPQRMPRGPHGLPALVAGRIHRTRILHATAQAMLEKGYADVTVKDIVARPGSPGEFSTSISRASSRPSWLPSSMVMRSWFGLVRASISPLVVGRSVSGACCRRWPG